MAALIANSSVDMTDWNFGNIKNGTITGHSTFKYSIAGADGQLSYQFTGVGLTYDSNFKLTGGTITGYNVLDSDGDTVLSIAGFEMAATALKNAVNTSDASGSFENTVFANNDTITGSSGDDVLAGLDGTNSINAGAGNDIIDASRSIQDSVNGGEGNDTIFMGSDPFVGTIDGGAGTDVVIWNMNQTLQLGLDSNYTGIEQIQLLGGPNYNFLAYDGFVGAGNTMRIDASALGSASRVYFDGQAETDGSYEFIGGAGRDRLWGGDKTDTFWLTEGGNDKVNGGAGTNYYYFGAALTAADRINGTSGYDDVFIDGDYSAGLVFDARTMRGVDALVLGAGHNYNLTLNDGNVLPGDSMIVYGVGLGPGNTETFDASAETDGELTISDGYGNDTITAGHGDDAIISLGGSDTLSGGEGNDQIIFEGGALDATDVVDGGPGTDELDLQGDYSDGVVFANTTMRNVETIVALDGGDFNLTTADGNLAAGKTLTVDASALTSSSQMIFDGSAESDGFLIFLGGEGDDRFIGGAKKDTFTGGHGADFLSGGAAADTFIYTDASESTGRDYDTIDGFAFASDLIDVAVAVTGVDPTVAGGAISTSNFDARLAIIIDAAHLAANHAVLFTPNSGTLAGHLFVIVDQNGVAGYQTGHDIVIDLPNATNVAGFSTATFV